MESLLLNNYSRYTTSEDIQKSLDSENQVGNVGTTVTISISVSVTVTVTPWSI